MVILYLQKKNYVFISSISYAQHSLFYYVRENLAVIYTSVLVVIVPWLLENS